MGSDTKGDVVFASGFLEPLLLQRAHAAGVLVLVTLGGDATTLRQVFNNTQLSARLATGLANFAARFSYDGIDLDYEVPLDAAQATSYAQFVGLLRKALPPGALLSMATTSDANTQNGYGWFDFPALVPLLDFFNVMTYDFYGPWSSRCGLNSPLFQSPIDPGRVGSCANSTSHYITALGVPASKINLGTVRWVLFDALFEC